MMVKQENKHHEIGKVFESYRGFINSNEMIGVGYEQDTGATKIILYNVKNQNPSDKTTLDKYYHAVNFNSDGKA